MKTKKEKWFNDADGDVVITASTCYTTMKKDYVQIMSKTILYKDFENPEEHIEKGTQLYNNLIEAYHNWPDGEVTVSVTIREPFVNM